MKRELIKVSNLDVVYDITYYGGYSPSIRDVVTSFSLKKFFTKDNRQKLHLLKDINLSVAEGDIVGILGINGVGKTTLCRHIAGLDGVESFCKGDVKSIFNTIIGVMPELTGRENAEVLVELLYTKNSKQERKKIVESSLEFSELGKFVDSPFKTYSKGMKARLFLSVVSARPSEILILDEVFDGADVFFNKKITDRVKSMIKESGCVLFVSHELEKLREVCNRGIVINNSVIEFDGDIEEAIHYYENNCNPLDGGKDGTIPG